MAVCAEDVEDGSTYCTSKHIADARFAEGKGYRLSLDPGRYRVYASVPARPGYTAYYSEFITCGSSVDCPSHEPVIVTVEGGGRLEGVDPGDWYDY
jgi:hypothetical protein